MISVGDKIENFVQKRSPAATAVMGWLYTQNRAAAGSNRTERESFPVKPSEITVLGLKQLFFFSGQGTDPCTTYRKSFYLPAHQFPVSNATSMLDRNKRPQVFGH